MWLVVFSGLRFEQRSEVTHPSRLTEPEQSIGAAEPSSRLRDSVWLRRSCRTTGASSGKSKSFKKWGVSACVLSSGLAQSTPNMKLDLEHPSGAAWSTAKHSNAPKVQNSKAVRMWICLSVSLMTSSGSFKAAGIKTRPDTFVLVQNTRRCAEDKALQDGYNRTQTTR